MQALRKPSCSRGRDLRLDLFRGLANWAIFLDHIPHEVLSSITTRNYGFSDAADLFVFISGYTAAVCSAKIMIERGFLAQPLRDLASAFPSFTPPISLCLPSISPIVGACRERFTTQTI